MAKRSATIRPTANGLDLTVHNAGVPDRTVRRDYGAALRTPARWRLKDPAKHVDAAIESGEPVEVAL